jgi:hypothetical protein
MVEVLNDVSQSFKGEKKLALAIYLTHHVVNVSI